MSWLSCESKCDQFLEFFFIIYNGLHETYQFEIKCWLVWGFILNSTSPAWTGLMIECVEATRIKRLIDNNLWNVKSIILARCPSQLYQYLLSDWVGLSKRILVLIIKCPQAYKICSVYKYVYWIEEESRSLTTSWACLLPWLI